MQNRLTQLTADQCKKILELFKTMKIDRALIIGNTIYGMKNNLSALSTTELEWLNILSPIEVINVDEVSLLYNEIGDAEFITCNIYNINNMRSDIIIRTMDTINYYYNFVDPNRNIVVQNFHENESFKAMNEGKSSDGTAMINIQGINIIIFKGFIPLNKNEKVDCQFSFLQNNIDSNMFISRYIVSKKKKVTINIYCLCLTLI